MPGRAINFYDEIQLTTQIKLEDPTPLRGIDKATSASRSPPQSTVVHCVCSELTRLRVRKRMKVFVLQDECCTV
ncbi:hypothetical protein J6590_070992 [Homalodisca vitripennis]|nr:hypothetical protein J6590_070992 [Homalodisca vitripennis]